MDLDHARLVLEHPLFSCSLQQLFEIYQNSKEDPDSTYLGMIYAIGRWRFGPKAWGDHHTEYFKQRARENATTGFTSPGKYSKRDAGKQLLSLADLGL